MYPVIEIFGRQISSYALMGVTGIVAGLIFSLVRCRKFGVSADDCAFIYVFGALGAVAGAKIFFILTVLPQFIGDLKFLVSEPLAFLTNYFTGGFVFYGGLVGALFAGWLTARFFSRRFSDFIPAIAPPFLSCTPSEESDAFLRDAAMA